MRIVWQAVCRKMRITKAMNEEALEHLDGAIRHLALREAASDDAGQHDVPLAQAIDIVKAAYGEVADIVWPK